MMGPGGLSSMMGGMPGMGGGMAGSLSQPATYRATFRLEVPDRFNFVLDVLEPRAARTPVLRRDKRK